MGLALEPGCVSGDASALMAVHDGHWAISEAVSGSDQVGCHKAHAAPAKIEAVVFSAHRAGVAGVAGYDHSHQKPS